MVTMDDLFAKVGEKVSGFGGFFYDQDGVPTIYMQESQDASSATQAMNPQGFWFSPLGAIEYGTELGNLSVCYDFSC
jgi:hypothetical protein